MVADAQAAALTNYLYAVKQSGRGSPSTNRLIDHDTVSFVLTPTATTATMKAVGEVGIKTPFIGVFTQHYANSTTGSLPVLNSSSENTSGIIAAGGPNLEVSVMIDITGSMTESDNSGSTKIDTVKTALMGNATTTGLIDTLIVAGQTNARVAIVPFSEAVNLGSAVTTTLARGTYLPGASTTPGSYQYQVGPRCGSGGHGGGDGGGGGGGGGGCQTFTISTTCVTERIVGNVAPTDVSPITSPVGRFYTSDGSCPTQAVMIPLSSDKVALKNTVQSLSANGYTAGQMGTAWAWYALSENFNSLWPVASAARPYSDLTVTTANGLPVLKKIAILMTDGDYNTEYCNGVSDRNITGGCTANNGTSNNQAAALCTAMKAKGIEVYTIGAQVSAAAKTFLQSCATDVNHYYDATNGAILAQAFKDISSKLIRPYLTH